MLEFYDMAYKYKSGVVSVVMSAYNSEEYLEEAVDSILAQTYSDWQLIFINDASTDRTKDVIHTYQDKRIKYIESRENLGALAARSMGFAIAEGEFITEMSADDILPTDSLQARVESLGNNQAIHAGITRFSTKIDEYIVPVNTHDKKVIVEFLNRSKNTVMHDNKLNTGINIISFM